jgi:hypothetical protein
MSEINPLSYTIITKHMSTFSYCDILELNISLAYNAILLLTLHDVLYSFFFVLFRKFIGKEHFNNILSCFVLYFLSFVISYDQFWMAAELS